MDIKKLNSITTSIIINSNHNIIKYHLVRVSSRLQPTLYLTLLKVFTFGQSMLILVGLLDLILHLTGRIEYILQARIFMQLFRSDPHHLMWREQRHRGFGRCHSAYPGKKLKNLMIYYTKLTLYVLFNYLLGQTFIDEITLENNL